jgi:hypothetical protein
MEKKEMYNVLLHQVKERENTFTQRDEKKVQPKARAK